MIKYVGEITCNGCGTTMFTNGTNKTTLLSAKELEELAEAKGWLIEKHNGRHGAGQHYCPVCACRRKSHVGL